MNGDVPFRFSPNQGDPHDPNAANQGFDMANLGAALQQIGAMLAAGGAGNSDDPVNWQLAHDTARQQLAEAGDPSVSDAEKRAVNDAVELANVWLDGSMQFPATATGAIAWSRSEWLEATLPAWQRMIAPIAEKLQVSMQSLMPGDQAGGTIGFDSGSLPTIPGLPEGLPPEIAAMAGPLIGMAKALGSAMFGMQVGQGLSALAADVVSAGDVGVPLTTGGHAALLPRNIKDFGSGLELPEGELLVFIALREAAHQRLFVHVPWLRGRVEGAIEAYAAGISVNTDRISEAMSGIDPTNPDALAASMSSSVFEQEDTEEQRAALVRLETLLALVEGWVDDVVDVAVAERLASYNKLREILRRRRATGGPAEKTFATLVGLELRPRRLQEAADLWQQLRAARGIAGRDALWDHPDLLPNGDDLDDIPHFLATQTASELDPSGPSDEDPPNSSA